MIKLFVTIIITDVIECFTEIGKMLNVKKIV